MPLSDDDKLLMDRLSRQLTVQVRKDAIADSYYEAEQKVTAIGLAVPPDLQDFGAVINVPAMAVDEPELRQDLREFQRLGGRRPKTSADPALSEAWLANNMPMQAPLVHKDEKIYGRSVVSVSTNEDDADHPLITVEDSTQIAYMVDNRKRRMVGALRRYRDEVERVERATLYTPDRTQWLVRSRNGWEIDDTDDHNLGVVPLVTFLNRPRTGRWYGVSEMRDVIGMTDMILRMMTNMSIGAETHALPDKWIAGVAKDDFIDPKTGKRLSTFDAYLTKIKTVTDSNAKFGQFNAGDLKNFHDSINSLLAWCAAVLGLPTRYAGQQSVNPASEGAIAADEVRLIKRVERMNDRDGVSWAWVGSLYERLRTGSWPATNSIRVLWYNPATPTRAQQADATSKLYGAGLLSREGAWDDMGWSPERKAREVQYRAQEAALAPATPPAPAAPDAATPVA